MVNASIKFVKKKIKLLIKWQIKFFWVVRLRILTLIWGKSYATYGVRYAPKSIITELMRMLNASIGENCDIESGITYHNCNDLSNLRIGNGVHIGKNCFIDLRNEVLIKDRCTISMGTTILTHADMGKSKISKYYPAEHKPVTIEEDVYIGANTTVLMDITIGSHSIVGAGSLVSKNVEPYSLVGGVPAKFIKRVQVDE